MEGYNGWKSIGDLAIVYSDYDTIEFNGKKYYKAYVTEAKNKKSIESAIRWATGHYDKNQKKAEPKIINTINDGFSFQVVSAAGNSWSHGGKLSFWMCLMEKKGVKPFVVGINSDLLCDFILETTLTNGKSSHDVFFARNYSQLGILHKDMSTYRELLNDEQLKKNLSKSKTSKWKLGYSYKTLTTEDVMLGIFSNILTNYYECENHVSRYNYNFQHKVFKLDFNQPDRVIYGYSYDMEISKNRIIAAYSYLLYAFRLSIGRYANKIITKCPARQEGEQIFEASETYYTDFIKYILSNTMPHNIENIIGYAFPLFKYSPDATLELLQYAKKFYTESINTFETIGLPDWIHDKDYYKNNARMWPTEKIIRRELYNDNHVSMYVDYLGERTECKTWTEVLDKMIEIVTNEKEKINATNSK